MSAETQIVAAMYRDAPALSFDDIVDEFELSLRAKWSGRRSVTFDYDDLVIIEIESLRIGLAWVEPENPTQPFSLIVASGPASEHGPALPGRAYCDRLNESFLTRINNRLPYDVVIRAALPGALDSELMDQVAGVLQGLEPVPEPAAPETLLDDIATSYAPSADAAEPRRSRRERGLTRLREVYRDTDGTHSPLWQAVLSSTGTMLETLSHGADIVRQMSQPEPANPYDRLRTRIRTRQITRSVTRPVTRPIAQPAHHSGGRFDSSEYELYGSLLD